MRGYTPAHEMVAPSSLEEALDLLRSEPEKWTPFAGGTDIMVVFESGGAPGDHFLSLHQIEEFNSIKIEDQYVDIGSMVTYSEIQSTDLLQKEFPSLCQAGSETGGIAIQNRGTLGGNIINASPAADSPPALMTYDAELEFISAKGKRWVKLDQFYSGYKLMDLQPGELLQTIRLKRSEEAGEHFYRKVGTRKAQAISKVVFAGRAWKRKGVIEDLRISIGSVAPMTIRCVETENVIRGQKIDFKLIQLASATLDQEIAPIDDVRSTMQFRDQVAINVLQEFMREIH